MFSYVRNDERLTTINVPDQSRRSCYYLSLPNNTTKYFARIKKIKKGEPALGIAELKMEA